MRRFIFFKGVCLSILLLRFGSSNIKRRSLEEESSLDFLTNHLKPELRDWYWDHLSASEETYPTVEGYEEGEIEEREVMPKMNMGREQLRAALVEVLKDLKNQGQDSGYINIEIPTNQMEKVIELKETMRREDWMWAWSTFRQSFADIPRNWERSIKAQVEQVTFIKHWENTKICASDDLKLCMEYLRAEESWPVFSGIEYGTFDGTVRLINKMRRENDGRDYQELRRLIPQRLLRKRLSSMEYISQRPDNIPHFYSEKELKLKELEGYDTLLIMMIEEPLYMASQLDIEPHWSAAKEKEAWEVFAKLFRILHDGDVTVAKSTTGFPYSFMNWPLTIEYDHFTYGETPQSHRFQHGFHSALRHVQNIRTIYNNYMDRDKVTKLLLEARNWSLSDILLGIHNGVDLTTFKKRAYLADPNDASYKRCLVEYWEESENAKTAEEYRFRRFIEARYKLKQNGILSSHIPLKSLNVKYQ